MSVVLFRSGLSFFSVLKLELLLILCGGGVCVWGGGGRRGRERGREKRRERELENETRVKDE